MSMPIYIRPITLEDTPLIVNWRNSPAVNQYFIFQAQLTEEDHIRWFNTQILPGHVDQFIIVESDTDTPIGSVYLRDIDQHHKKGEFGIFIGNPAARGKGYGGIAAKLLLRHAFEVRGLNKVFLRVFAGNTAAITCYSHAGFKTEGVAPEDVIINGVPTDIVYMGALKSEWKEGMDV